MKNLFRLLGVFATIYLTSILFPSLVQVESWQLALEIAFVIVLGESLLSLLMIAFLLPAMITAVKYTSINIAVGSIILTLIVGVVFYPIALFVASKHIVGFQVMSKLGYIILSFAMIIFSSESLSSKQEDSSI